MNLFGKNVVVYGAGVSGLAAYALVRELGGRAVVFDDDPKAPHATSSVGVFEDADLVIVSPGVGGSRYLQDAMLAGKTVVGELEFASKVCLAEQIAVTGTNGKTTTVRLIDEILRAAGVSSRAVGNIGSPFSSIADKLDSTECVVVEASSFQLEGSSFSPEVAVLLNITPDHLERHGTMQRYIAAKSNIFLHQSESDTVIYNADDENVRALIPYMNAVKIPFSTKEPVDGAYLSSGFICFKGTPVVELEDIDFCGREIENALAATAVALARGISRYTVASVLSTFKRPEYRRKRVGEIDGVRVFNDSKATNVASALSAVEGTDGKTVLILGGAKRAENFSELFSALPQSVCRTVVAGENAAEIITAAAVAGIECEAAADIEDALCKAVAAAREEGAENVLFSPASKSFDRYSGYEERGRAFDLAFSRLTKK